MSAFSEADVLSKTPHTDGNAGLKHRKWDFPGGAEFENPPANAGVTGLIPGPGRSHMPRSN